MTNRSFAITVLLSTLSLICDPLGAQSAGSAELEFLADVKTSTDGFGEDFAAAGSLSLTDAAIAAETGDSIQFTIVAAGVSVVGIAIPEPLPISEFRYLAVRVKARPNSMYFIRPSGLDAAGVPAEIWWEEAETDDRIGTGDWEILTISLPALAAGAGTGATRITARSLGSGLLGRDARVP